MNIDISVSFNFRVPFTQKDLDILIALAERHYDGTCKDAGKGFLARWKAQIAALETWHRENPDDPDSPNVNASSFQLGICSKILEMPIPIDQVDEMAPSYVDMRRSFHGALSLANRNFHTWKATYTG